MRSLIIYHRVDYDGVFSLMVAKYALSHIDDIESVDALGYNYGENIPEIPLDYDQVIMVDISFPPEVMMELKKRNDENLQQIIWIDHHITAIDDSSKYGYDTLPGLRYNGQAAVENTWDYFYEGEEAPMIIQLLGTYDVWNKSRYDWENLVLPLQFALKAIYNFDLEKIWEELPELFTADITELEKTIIWPGTLILKYLRGTWKSAVKHYSFPCTVGEKYSGLAMLTTEYSSNAFGEETKNYDVCIVLNYNPQTGMFKTSMYVDPERDTDFHAGEYMKLKFGGGGHRGAAGGQVPMEDFLRLIQDGKI